MYVIPLQRQSPRMMRAVLIGTLFAFFIGVMSTCWGADSGPKMPPVPEITLGDQLTLAVLKQSQSVSSLLAQISANAKTIWNRQLYLSATLNDKTNTLLQQILDSLKQQAASAKAQVQANQKTLKSLDQLNTNLEKLLSKGSS